jgi:hypothetical protein
MPDLGRIPGALVIPNCVQVRLAWTLPNSKTVYNVMHASVAGGFTATSTVAEAVFAAIKAAAGWTSWKARLHTTVGFAGVDLRDLRAANFPLAASTGAAAAGTGATGAIPPGDALCVTLRTNNAGRGFRGRVYLPGLDFSALAAGGVAAAGTVTDATAFVTAVQTALSGQAMTLCIAQPERAAYTGTTGAAHAHRDPGTPAVTSIVTRNNVIDHQRRRAGRS